MAGSRGTAVVLAVDTGRVLASYRLKVAAQRLAAPGSSIKPFTLKALLNAGKVDANTALVCKRPLNIAGHRLDCSHPANRAAAGCRDGSGLLLQLLLHKRGDAAYALRSCATVSSSDGFTRATGLAPDEVAGTVALASSTDELQLQAIGEWGVQGDAAGIAARVSQPRAAGSEHDRREAGSRFFRASTARPATAWRGRHSRRTAMGWRVKPAPPRLSEGSVDARLVCRLRSCRQAEIVLVVFLEKGRGSRCCRCGAPRSSLRFAEANATSREAAGGKQADEATSSLLALLLTWTVCAASPPQAATSKSKNIGPPSSGFPQTVRVRLWYLHPPASLQLRADAGQAQFRKCATCAAAALTLALHCALGCADSDRRRQRLPARASHQRRIPDRAAEWASAAGRLPRRDRRVRGRLLITATMPMEEYIAGVLAGETGNFKSDEALKAMAVAARTYAMHFGSRHALEDFDFCDTTHCQDLRIAGINDQLAQDR